MAESVSQAILRFHDRLVKDPHHRYRSWEHCFGHFQKRETFCNSEQLDVAALHLAFYLASWGMYRGSSFLLWKDYTIHRKAVRTLLQGRYAGLWDSSSHDQSSDAEKVESLLGLFAALRKSYVDQITLVNGERRSVKPSDTLITKMLLGTIGCVPACDRYFIVGFRSKGYRFTRFGKEFIAEVLRFCRLERAELSAAEAKLQRESKVRYPIMKLVDMYFWQLGFDLIPEAGVTAEQ